MGMFFIQISGAALIQAVLYILVAAVIFWLVTWALAYVGVPEPFNKIIRLIVAIVVVIFLINVLLTLVGHPFIKW